MTVQTNSWKMRLGQTLLLLAAMTLLMGAGDNDARFKDLGHRMMCTCGCGQILLECNHVGCQSSDRMRGELMAALGMTNGGDGGTPSGGAKTGDNDDLILQSFVQKYGPTVIAAPSTTGFGRVAWITPFVALLVGLTTVGVVVRAWKHRPAPALADGVGPAFGADLDRFREQARKETDL